MTRSLTTEKEKGYLIQALTRLVQAVTFILLIHVVQAGLTIILTLLHLFMRFHQPASIV